MPCSKVSINKNFKCEKAGCICLPTGGKPCICVCENENGDIMRCDECKCLNSDTCQCKCDDSKCTCIVTKGADCICVCRDGRGNIKAYDCCSIKSKNGCCSKEMEKETCGNTCNCDGQREIKESRRTSTSKNYKCDKAGCVCLPTGGKSCICVCQNENGDIMRCDECKCSNSGNCQCKCDDSKCTCIVTKGADCICVCRDVKGNIMTCDCSCIEVKGGRCCKKEPTFKSCACCCKKPEKEACGINCEDDGNWDYKKMRRDGRKNFKTCDCCCIDVKDARSCNKELDSKSCECCNKLQACGKNCNWENGKKDCKELRHSVAVSKNYKFENAGSICMPTGGKRCICVCENDNGDIVRCDDCKCTNFGNCQCKCDVSKCTCIDTKRADCICVCQAGREIYKTNGCCCIEPKDARCCKKEVNVKPYGCCIKDLEKEACGSHCKCNEKRDSKSSRAVTVSKNNKCDKPGCICIPTGEKSCICLDKDDSAAFEGGNCKCSSLKYCCKKTSFQDHEKQKTNCGQNCKSVVNKEGCKNCSPKNKKPTCKCCGKDDTIIYKTCNSKAIEFQYCSLNKKSCSCCKINDSVQEKNNDKQGCVCVSRETRYSRVPDNDCVCNAKKITSSCTCCY